jgi:enoyl-CoA hydratase/carnithine racemase
MSNEILAAEARKKVGVNAMPHRPHNLMELTTYRALLAAFAEALERGSRAILLRSGLRQFAAGAEANCALNPSAMRARL